MVVKINYVNVPGKVRKATEWNFCRKFYNRIIPAKRCLNEYKKINVYAGNKFTLLQITFKFICFVYIKKIYKFVLL